MQLTLRFCTLLALTFLLTSRSNAQKEWATHWHFGDKLALDFSGGAPVLNANTAMQTAEGCAAISDDAGGLLFYSNGGDRDPIQSGGQPAGTIWNRQNEVMYDMSFTEGGGWSAAQSSVAFPKPGEPGKYYLFTMEEAEFDIGGSVPGQPEGRGLSYFIIDMALNGGLGGVESYTEGLYLPTFEGLCAVRHANGTDYWIIVHQSDGNGFAVFSITAAGVGNPAFFDPGLANGGVIKSSPDGQWLAASSGDAWGLYAFDWSTGAISNARQLPVGGQVEFSANSRYLYGTTAGFVTQDILRFDLLSADIPGSVTTIGSLPQSIGSDTYLFSGYLQLGPDRNIYFYSLYNAGSGQRVFLSAITCANTGGALDANILFLKELEESSLIFLGLPNFPAQWLADNTADPLPVNLGMDETICPGESLMLDAGIADASYLWSTGDTTRQIEVADSGNYSVTVTAGCGQGVDTVTVNQVEVSADAGPAGLEVCEGTPTRLEASAIGTFSWQPTAGLSDPNSLSPLALPERDTFYILTAEEEGCLASDTVYVRLLPSPVALAEPADTTIAPGESIELLASGGAIYAWSPSEGLSCTDCPNPEASPGRTTTYLVTVSNAEGCTATDTVLININEAACILAVPNAFTPNGDGINDFFKPVLLSEQNLSFSVFNRWGQQVYEYSPVSEGWDGTFEGVPAPSEVYFFVARAELCGEEKVTQGDVTLLR